MKRTIAILLVAVIALMLFAACSNTTDKDDEEDAGTTNVDAGDTDKKDGDKEEAGKEDTNQEEAPAAPADPLAELYGTWVLDFESMMSELSEEERAMMEAFGVTADQFTMEYTFNEDGTGKVTGNMMGETMEEEFTYTAKDGRLEITATVDGETNTTGANYEIKDDTLTITEEGESMTFKRK